LTCWTTRSNIKIDQYQHKRYMAFVEMESTWDGNLR
jgi:hypothetical protein